MPDIKTIGFVGLGNMGGPMAKNLIKAGYSLWVYDLNPAAVKALTELGANPACSLGELTERSDAIVTILPADKQIREVYTGQDGILDHISAPKLCIEMTSAMGSTLREVAQEAKRRECPARFVDAPVSGGVPGAEAGTLTIMVGGEERDAERAWPVLSVLGSTLKRAGRLGDGKAFKMLNQMLNAMNTAALCEALLLADKLNLDGWRLLEILGESSGGSWVSAHNGEKFLLSGQYQGGFKVSLMKKDVGLAMAEARRLGLELPAANLVMESLEKTVERFGSDPNYNILFEWMKGAYQNG
ncbi:MAG: NAD(P)-dependent oxidoreductase [Oscillospiraceae bacterium]|nr:NAD(P)-dependent oxidoreductase [Oscillospiraceae bacterium]